jgi:hypothetical protein
MPRQIELARPVQAADTARKQESTPKPDKTIKQENRPVLQSQPDKTDSRHASKPHSSPGN